jgi:hypothetical protein
MTEARKLYIHEQVEIIGHNRARYMHHMTANWCPVARAERNQLCFGVWGTVGSTGRWPEVVNMWELEGWDGLVANFEHELSHPSMQDPSLASWWAVAATLRRGGLDRILVPTASSRSIEELLAAGVRGEVYAHEIVKLPPGRADAFLDAVEDEGRTAAGSHGLELVGAYRVAMVNGSECVVIWACASWRAWASFERAWDAPGSLGVWRSALLGLGADVRRTLMVDSPLSPMRIGRQPSEADRRPLEEI